jgi:hypothetical protein
MVVGDAMKRVQRTRKKGEKGIPEGAIYVGRPSRFGNPWGNWCEVALSLALYEDMAKGIWDPGLLRGYDDFEVRHIYGERQDWLRRLGGGHPAGIIQVELAGTDLACWCPVILDGAYMPCHADILLSISNDIPMDEVIRENTRRAAGETLR